MTSREFAGRVSKDHNGLCQLIERHKGTLEKYGPVERREVEGHRRKQLEYHLNKRQEMYLLAVMVADSPGVVRAKMAMAELAADAEENKEALS